MMIAQELEAHGQPGAVHMLDTYDAWYPGYIDYMPYIKHSVVVDGNAGRQLFDSAPPRRARRTSVWCATISSRRFRLQGTQSRGALPESVDRRRVEFAQCSHYMVTAGFATLKYAAMNKDELLYNRLPVRPRCH